MAQSIKRGIDYCSLRVRDDRANIAVRMLRRGVGHFVVISVMLSGCASAPNAVPVSAADQTAEQRSADAQECDDSARRGYDPWWRARNVAWYLTIAPLTALSFRFPIVPIPDKPDWVGPAPIAGRAAYLEAYRDCMVSRGYNLRDLEAQP